MEEPGSELVQAIMAAHDAWYTCRVGYVEVLRATTLIAGSAVAQRFTREWGGVTPVEVDAALAQDAARLALHDGLRSLDALHLAAALVLPVDDLVMATWDKRLWQAARAHDLRVLPDVL